MPLSLTTSLNLSACNGLISNFTFDIRQPLQCDNLILINIKKENVCLTENNLYVKIIIDGTRQ